MQQNKSFQEFARQFANLSTQELINHFNSQVGNRGWTSMRAYHDQALIEELQRRQVDVSSVYVGETIKFDSTITIKQ